jgi:Flp pilus assembly protein TadD
MKRYFTSLLGLLMMLSVTAGGAEAGQRDPSLPALFDRLTAGIGEPEADAVQSAIWARWMRSDDPTIESLMTRGIAALSQRLFGPALVAFDEMVTLAPDFAEAWNKRATLHFLMSDFPASVADIHRTLELEPRHWGALAGLGQIYLILGEPEAALKPLRQAFAINPYLDGVRMMIEQAEIAMRKGRI